MGAEGWALGAVESRPALLVSGDALWAPGWLGFPSLAAGNLGSGPCIPAGSSPLPVSLDSARPQPRAGVRWASPTRNSSWGRGRGSRIPPSSSTVPGIWHSHATWPGPVRAWAVECPSKELRLPSASQGRSSRKEGPRGAQVSLLGKPWPHPAAWLHPWPSLGRAQTPQWPSPKG